MADLSFVQVAPDSTGKRLRTTAVADGGATMHQEIMTVAGGTGDIWEPTLDAIPSSSSVSMPARIVTTSSSVLIGSVHVPNNVNVNLLTSPLSVQTNAGVASNLPVQIFGAASSAVLGTVLSATSLTGAAIDPRQSTIVAATSGAVLWTVGAGSSGVTGTSLISTALAGAAIDPRQATIVAATSGAGLGTILSTAVGSAAIDPRIISSVGTTVDVRVIGAGSSGVVGTVLISTALAGAAIDPRQVTVVAGTSGAYISVLNATAAAGATIDPRQSTIVGGTSGAGVGTIVSTAAGAAAIDPRQSTIVAATSGAVLWTVGAGSSGVTGTTLISTALAGAAIDPRIIAAQATSVVLGTVGVQQSTSYVSVVRGFADSTANYNEVFYWSTGIVAAAAATMQSLNITKNLSSGSSGTSFNVSAGRIFRIQHIEGSIRVSSAASLFADFAIRAVTTTGGATGTNFPVWSHRAVANAGTTAALAAGGDQFVFTGLEIDLPSSASFGVSITSNSTASQECTLSFGGKEYVI